MTPSLLPLITPIPERGDPFLEALRAVDEAIIRAILLPVDHSPARCSTLATIDQRFTTREGMVHGAD